MRKSFYPIFILLFLLIGGIAYFWLPILVLLVLIVPLFILGVYDMHQSKHAIRRNYPVAGRLRYLFEAIRPEIQQYFV